MEREEREFWESMMATRLRNDPTAAAVCIRGLDNMHCTATDCPDKSAPVYAIAAAHQGSGELAIFQACEHCWPKTDARLRRLFGKHLINTADEVVRET